VERRPLARRRGNRSLLAIAALFIAVLVAEAVAIAIAAPDIADIATLYGATT